MTMKEHIVRKSKGYESVGKRILSVYMKDGIGNMNVESDLMGFIFMQLLTGGRVMFDIRKALRRIEKNSKEIIKDLNIDFQDLLEAESVMERVKNYLSEKEKSDG